MNTHTSRLPSPDPMGQGDDRYLLYIEKWYEALHPDDHVRYATLVGEAGTLEHPGTLTFLEIINDSRAIVWNAKTGGRLPYEMELDYGYVRRTGSSFPEPGYMAYIATRLARKQAAHMLPYPAGTRETDLPLQEAIAEEQIATVYFNDGVIMLVKIPTCVQKDNGETIEAICGFIAYSLIQHTRTSLEESLQVVSKDVYQALFATTEPRKIGT